MFELSWRWLALGLDASLKAALVALLAAAVLMLLRIQDSNVRHRVWAGVLGGMLLLPALTLIVPAWRLPLPAAAERWMALGDIEPARGVTTETPLPISSSDVARPGDSIENVRSWPPGDERDRLSRRRGGEWSRLSGFAPDSAELSAAGPGSGVRPTAEINAGVAPAVHTTQPAESRPPAWRWTALAVTAACLLWLGGALTMASRLLLGMWTARRLLAESLTLDPADLPANPQESIPVRECPFIRVPLTVGCCRPQILLPPEWIDWPTEKLRAVLAHERMHAARGDCAVALVAEMNCCLYWFHPLAWWLRRQLSSLAEQACDDAAIDSTGDRTQYARHLLEVAAAVSQQRGRLVPTGVSMARQSNVENRIHAILDFTRPLSRRLTWLSTLGLVAVRIPLIALAAALQPTSGKQEEAKPDAAAATSEQPKDPVKSGDGPSKVPAEDVTFNFAGSVVDHRGQPVAGASISFGYLHEKQSAGNPPKLATTDEQGKFQFSRKRSELIGTEGHTGWADAGLIVTKEGYGFAIGAVQYFDTSGRLDAELTEREREIIEYEYGKKSTVLTLVPDDVPIRGRILDSEGRPIAGAKIELASIWQGASGTLDAWLAAAKQPGADELATNKHLRPLSIAGYAMTGNYPLSASHLAVVPPVRTGDDGWFTIKGIGRDRIIQLYVSGKGIATMPLHTRSRQGEPLRLSGRASLPELGGDIYHPAEFTCIASPSIPVTGRVTDKRTSQPLAGYLVRGEKIATNEVYGGLESMYIHTKTDADGRYRLEGLPLGENTIQFAPPHASSHLIANVEATTAASSPPLVRDVELVTGVKVRGRVTDSQTGKPLEGHVTYFAFQMNPHLREATGFDSPTFHYRADSDGRYEIPVLPGKGILAFIADNHREYPRGVGADRIDGPKTDRVNDYLFRTEPSYCNPHNFHLVTPLDLAADAGEVTLDLALTGGVNVAGRVRAADGQPLGEYYLYGEQAFAGWHNRRTGKTFQVKGYFPEEGRRLMVYHPERNLVGIKDLTGPAPDDLEIVLHPGGVLIGRVTDADGLPIENLAVESEWGDVKIGTRYSPAVAKTWGELPTHLEGRQLLTDKDGRFELKGIMPGLTYSAGVTAPSKMYGRTQTMYLGPIFESATADPGQTKDLGNLTIKPYKPKKNDEPKAEEKAPVPPANFDQANAAPAPSDSADPPLRGRVLSATGQAIAGAKIHWMESRNPDLNPKPPRLLATTDASGDFSCTLPASSVNNVDEPLASTSQQRLVVVAPGHGFVLTSPDELRRQIAAAAELIGNPKLPMAGNALPLIRLPAAGDPIRGRLVNIDGQPIAGVTVKIRWFDDATGNRSFRRNGAATADEKTAWADRVNFLIRIIEPVQLREVLPTATTDAAGRFELRDLGANRLFHLLVQSDQAESKDLVVRNQPGEAITIPPDLGSRDKELILHPREFVHALGPSNLTSGRVTDRDTGEPIAGAVIRAFNTNAISHFHSSNERQEFATRTDAQGRYRISGLLNGKPTRLVAFATGDVPYIPISRAADSTDGESTGKDFRLQRGIWASGRVYDAQTDKPFKGEINYFWFGDGKLEQEPGSYYAFVEQHHWTNAKGEFRVPILPTRGVLAFHFPWATPDQDGLDRYPIGAGKDSIDGHEKIGRQYPFQALPTHFFPGNYQRLVQIKPQPGQTTIHVDMPLHASQSIQVRIVDAQGQPVGGCEVSGASSGGNWWPQRSAEFAIEGLPSGERRKVLVFHRQRNLAGGLIVKQGDAQPVEIKLAPAGSVTGRLVDEDGEPITDGLLNVNKFVQNDTAGIWANDPNVRSNPTTIPVDDKGRFQLDGLIPGWTYSARVTAPKRFIGKTVTTYTIGHAFADVRIAPGEKKDLGDLVVRQKDSDQK